MRVATSGNLWAEWANAHRSHPIDDPNQLPVGWVGWAGWGVDLMSFAQTGAQATQLLYSSLLMGVNGEH